MFTSVLPVTFDARDIVSISLQNDTLCPNHRHRATTFIPPFLKDLATNRKRILQLPKLASVLKNPNFDTDQLCILFENLDVCLIPSSSWNTIFAKRAIDLSHHTVVVVIGLVADAKYNPRLVEALHDAWPSLWAWIRFLLVNVVEKDGNALRPTQQVLQCLGHMATPLASNRHFHGTLARTPSFLQILAYHWLEEEESETRRGRKGLEQLLTRAFRDVLQIGFSELSFNDVAQAVGPKTIARFALRRVQRKIEKGPFVNEDFMLDLSLVMHISSPRRKSPILDDVLVAGSPRQAVKVLRALDSEPVTFHAVQATTSCYLLLSDACKHPMHGRRCILQALNAGLFAAIPGTIPFLRKISDPGQLSLSHDLFENMIPHFLDMLVVRVVSRELKLNPSMRHVDAPLKDKVAPVLQLVDTRHKILRYSNQTSRQCCLCKNDGEAGQERLKECMACHAARYCSRRCQAADWPAHRATCLRAQSQMDKFRTDAAEEDLSNFVLPYRQRKFAETVTAFDIVTRKDEIRAKLAPLSHVPRSDFLVNIDFTKMPAALSISRDPRPEVKPARSPQMTAMGYNISDDLMVQASFLLEGKLLSIGGPYASSKAMNF